MVLFTYGWEDKTVHIFPNGINPQMNVIAWMEFEVATIETAVQHFSHYSMGTPPGMFEIMKSLPV